MDCMGGVGELLGFERFNQFIALPPSHGDHTRNVNIPNLSFISSALRPSVKSTSNHEVWHELTKEALHGHLCAVCATSRTLRHAWRGPVKTPPPPMPTRLRHARFRCP